MYNSLEIQSNSSPTPIGPEVSTKRICPLLPVNIYDCVTFTSEVFPRGRSCPKLEVKCLYSCEIALFVDLLVDLFMPALCSERVILY